jgi:cbb3-type cytochrome oxidase maturation protein
MDILYLLVPLSVVLVFAIVGALAWSVYNGQFDELERHGTRILDAEDGADAPKRGAVVLDTAEPTDSRKDPPHDA